MGSFATLGAKRRLRKLPERYGSPKRQCTVAQLAVSRCYALLCNFNEARFYYGIRRRCTYWPNEPAEKMQHSEFYHDYIERKRNANTAKFGKSWGYSSREKRKFIDQQINPLIDIAESLRMKA